MTLDEEKKLLKEEYRITADRADPWGTAMGWFFTLADELHFRFDVGYTPPHWEYRPSPLGPTNDPDNYETTVCKEVGADTLIYFGNLLYRYCRRLERAGLSY